MYVYIFECETNKFQNFKQKMSANSSVEHLYIYV